MSGRKIGVGLNHPLVIEGQMTGVELGCAYDLMRRVARSGIGPKRFSWQRSNSLVETLRQHRDELTRRPKR